MKNVKKIKTMQKKKKQPLSLIVNLKAFTRTSCNILTKKYTAKNYSYSYISLNNLILNHKSTILSKYKEFQILNNKTEYLIRYYAKKESFCRLKQFIAYYNKYSYIFPNYTPLTEFKILYENISKKQKAINHEYSARLQSKLLKNKNNNNEIFFDNNLKNELRESNSSLFNNSSMMSISNNIKKEINNYIPNNDSNNKSINDINDLIDAMSDNKIDARELKLLIMDGKSINIKKSHDAKKIIIRKKINRINNKIENFSLNNKLNINTEHPKNKANIISKIKTIPKKIPKDYQKQFEKFKTNSFLASSNPNIKKNNLINNQKSKNNNNIIKKDSVTHKKISSNNNIYKTISPLSRASKKTSSVKKIPKNYYQYPKNKSTKNQAHKFIKKGIFQKKESINSEYFKENIYPHIITAINISNYDTDDCDYQGGKCLCNTKNILTSKDNIFQNNTISFKKNNNNFINSKKQSMNHIKNNNILDETDIIIKSAKKTPHKLNRKFYSKSRLTSFGNTYTNNNSKNIFWKELHKEILEKKNTIKNKSNNYFDKSKLNNKYFKSQVTLKSAINNSKYPNNFDIKKNNKIPYNSSVIIKKRKCSDNGRNRLCNSIEIGGENIFTGRKKMNKVL